MRGLGVPLAQVTLGLTPATISPFVIDRMGAGHASRYFLTAEKFGASEALRVSRRLATTTQCLLLAC